MTSRLLFFFIDFRYRTPESALMMCLLPTVGRTNIQSVLRLAVVQFWDSPVTILSDFLQKLLFSFPSCMKQIKKNVAESCSTMIRSVTRAPLQILSPNVTPCDCRLFKQLARKKFFFKQLRIIFINCQSRFLSTAPHVQITRISTTWRGSRNISKCSSSIWETFRDRCTCRVLI